jgi:molybdenum cofactor synthesis domain-containing protein
MDDASGAAAKRQSGAVTAAMLIIGNEVLSGRTQDKNLAHVALQLGEIGIDMREVRIVPDELDVVVAAVNALRAAHDYVFTTGGIGPTHDDITADCIAAAFGVALSHHPLAMQQLQAHYDRLEADFNEARQRMARIPEGASLIDNPVSTAPGFCIENVYVMAGVPKIMQAMMENVLPSLRGGEALSSITVTSNVPEGKIAAEMGLLQAQYEEVNIGLYPFYGPDGAGVSVVARGRDMAQLAIIEGLIKAHLAEIGAELVERVPAK